MRLCPQKTKIVQSSEIYSTENDEKANAMPICIFNVEWISLSSNIKWTKFFGGGQNWPKKSNTVKTCVTYFCIPFCEDYTKL